MFEDRVASVFSMALTTDEDVISIDGSEGVDACDNCVEVKMVVEIADDTVDVADFGGDPHITLKFPFNPPKFQVAKVFRFYHTHIDIRLLFRYPKT